MDCYALEENEELYIRFDIKSDTRQGREPPSGGGFHFTSPFPFLSISYKGPYLANTQGSNVSSSRVLTVTETAVRLGDVPKIYARPCSYRV